MTQVITFEGFIPSPRFDSIPWTEVRIEESVSSNGPWTQIDVLALVPVDADPANPQIRNFTTELANDGELWYRVIFADATGDTLQPSTPLFNAAPTETDTGPNWISGDDVAECCDSDGSSDTTIFESAAELASQLLYQYSGRQFPGILERTVRPCRTGCGCPWQVLSRGYVIWNPNWTGPWGWGGWTCSGEGPYGSWCGCQPLSRVLLAGYVQGITEVVIDGSVVDPATYRVDRNRWLVRVRELETEDFPNWPGCQDLTLPESETGTWAVTYTYGRQVPLSGIEAAKELACEFYKLCSGQPCALPANTTRVIRQGTVQERVPWRSFVFEKGGRSIPRGWNTGMPKVDAFLAAYNPGGITRAPIFWSPAASLKYAQQAGL